MKVIKKINRFDQPPVICASIGVAADAIVRQTYTVTTGEYYPDHRLIPLVLTPKVSYTLQETGASVENAASQLINGHWYRLDSTTKLTSASGLNPANEITTGDLYTIDTVIGSPTYGRLTIKENFLPDNPVTFLFVATLNRGNGYSVSASFKTETDRRSILPRLSFDNNELAVYNPLEGDAKNFTINPTVTPSGLSATFEWFMSVNGAWQSLGSDPRHWAVAKSGNGVVIDRSVMPDTIDLKCVATINTGGASIKVEKSVSHIRRIPKFRYDITEIAGLKDNMNTIAPQCLIQTKRMNITDPGEELAVSWLGSGSARIATGMKPSIPLSSLGAAMELGMEITDPGGYKILIDDDSSYFVDDDGSYIVCK